MAGTVRERTEKLQLLNRMAADLPLASSLDEVQATVHRYASSIIGGVSYLWIADQFSRTLIPIPSATGPTTAPVEVECPCAVARSFVERRSIVVGSGGDVAPGTRIAEGLAIGSGVILPLTTSEGVVGVLVIVGRDRRRTFPIEDEVLARTMANTIAPVMMARLRAEAQARAAAALQALLLPAETPDIGADLSSAYIPAEEIAGLGGDYYDIIQLEDARWALMIGDVSGKGLDAARYVGTAKYVIRSYILEYGSPKDAMYWSNRVLALEEAGKFITVFCCVIDLNSRTLTYANAGHVPGYVYRSGGGTESYLLQGGIALGLMSDASYTEEQINLASGDILCVFTDGITEARRGREWFGEEGVAEVVRKSAERSSEDIRDAILHEVRAFIGDGLRDDVALIVLRMP